MKKAFLRSALFVLLCILLAYLEILPGIKKESVYKYYCLDYVGIFFVLSAQTLLKSKNKTAFLLYITGLVSNAVFGYIANSMIIVLFSFYSSWIFIQNWRQWKKDEESQSTSK